MTVPRIRFLIGGVQKAGTSALATYLGRHPRIALPEGKEAHVFDASDFDDDLHFAEVDARYAAHFPDQDQGVLHGDATPIYILHPRFIQRIARYNPAMRWLILLRDPAERAVSHYQMERSRGNERWPLWPAMLFESSRLRGHRDDFTLDSPLRHHSYRLRGDYARQLDALYTHFPYEQVLLLKSRELREDPTGTLRKACEFLGIETFSMEVQPESVFTGDYSKLPRNGFTMRGLRWWMRRELRDMRERYGIRFEA